MPSDLGVLGEEVAVDRKVALGRLDPRVPDADALGAAVDRTGVAVIDVDWRVRYDPRGQVAEVVGALSIVEQVDARTRIARLRDADLWSRARRPRSAVVVSDARPIRGRATAAYIKGRTSATRQRQTYNGTKDNSQIDTHGELYDSPVDFDHPGAEGNRHDVYGAQGGTSSTRGHVRHRLRFCSCCCGLMRR